MARTFPRVTGDAASDPHPRLPDTSCGVGIGSPAIFSLHEFGRLVKTVFGEYPILVGSALTKKHPRDVDIRVQLTAQRFEELFGSPLQCGGGSVYAAICM